MRLDGKVAFISGAARGMGEVEARLFANEGCKVGIGDVLEAEGNRVADEINGMGGEALFVRLDVTSETDWKDAISGTVSRFGKLDVLVNNAGIGGPALLEDATVEDWDETMAINGKGVFLGTKTAIPEMRKAGGGSIINISSQYGIVGAADSSAQYQASKGAVRQLTKATAIQYARDGIRANSVHPASVLTPMNEERMADPELRGLTVAHIPLGRLGKSEDIAYGVLYLASDESSYVTGSELVIDGGWTAQ